MEVCDGLVPELQRRGLTRKAYAHKHLADNLKEFWRQGLVQPKQRLSRIRTRLWIVFHSNCSRCASVPQTLTLTIKRASAVECTHRMRQAWARPGHRPSHPR